MNRFSLELLDSRCLLAASVVSGTLYVTGSDSVDRIRVYVSQNVLVDAPAQYVVEHNGTRQTFAADAVKRVVVRAGRGGDAVDLGYAGATHEAVQQRAVPVPVTILGGGGPDVIRGGSGAALVYGDAGNDVLNAGYAGTRATIDGGDGNDHLLGGDRDDRLLGGPGDDLVEGGGSFDHLEGGDGNDYLFGGSGNDFLSGGNGNDTVRGGTGADTLYGGGGRDAFYAGIDALTEMKDRKLEDVLVR